MVPRRDGLDRADRRSALPVAGNGAIRRNLSRRDNGDTIATLQRRRASRQSAR